jgi:glycyl-tRNA synthetase
MAQQSTLDVIVSLAKRRGFVFQSSEIYGGLNGCWDYGSLGVELLNNLKSAWWKSMTYRDDIEGVDAAILMHPRVWEASGHVANFTDPMIDNKQSKGRYRADTLIEDYIAKLEKQGKTDKAAAVAERLAAAREPEDFYNIIVAEEIVDPVSGTKEWTPVRYFNLMFKTFVGSVEDASSAVYLRPETAQGIFVNFKNVMESSRQKVPFGIAQIGKAFRNEINTKYFLFRTREFEQMEMQYFIKPGTHTEQFERWRDTRLQWFLDLGMKRESLRLKPHDKLAHYAAAAEDIEFKFPFGWGEIEGIHSRTDFDLSSHEKFSGKKLEFVDTATKERFVPYVIETSVGASRSFMAFLCNAYDVERIAPDGGEGSADGGEGGKDGGDERTVLRFHPKLAPVKAAVFPLVKKDGMPEFADKLYRELQQSFNVQYDEAGAVGRRYRRQDEIGTPFCITVDGESLTSNTVTVRHRDSMQQERIAADKVREYVGKALW